MITVPSIPLSLPEGTADLMQLRQLLTGCFTVMHACILVLAISQRQGLACRHDSCPANAMLVRAAAAVQHDVMVACDESTHTEGPICTMTSRALHTAGAGHDQSWPCSPCQARLQTSQPQVAAGCSRSGCWQDSCKRKPAMGLAVLHQAGAQTWRRSRML